MLQSLELLLDFSDRGTEGRSAPNLAVRLVSASRSSESIRVCRVSANPARPGYGSLGSSRPAKGSDLPAEGLLPEHADALREWVRSTAWS